MFFFNQNLFCCFSFLNKTIVLLMSKMSILAFILNKQAVYLCDIKQLSSVFDNMSELKERSCFSFVKM